MEWLNDNPETGRRIYMLIALGIAVTGLFLGRKRLVLAIPAALIFLLWAAIAIPGMVGARPTAQQNACINNLRQIYKAKIEWARINNKLPEDVPNMADLNGTVGTNRFLRHSVSCARGGTYTIGSVAQDPACSLADKGHRLD